MTGTYGFQINGVDAAGISGRNIASIGDLNGGGLGDLLISADAAAPTGRTDAGESDVVFGTESLFRNGLDLQDLNGRNGFKLNGFEIESRSGFGFGVGGGGDFNGDGIDGILIGASSPTRGSQPDVGESYVVFGKRSGFSASFDLSSLDGSNGFRLYGIDRQDNSGITVAGGGDINGDGIDDIVINASGGDPAGLSAAGETMLCLGAALILPPLLI